MAPAPSVLRAPAPVVESIAPAPMVEFIAPAPAVSESPAPVIEYFSPAPAGFQAPARMVEFVAPAPTVIPSLAPVEDHIFPVHSLRPGQGFNSSGWSCWPVEVFRARESSSWILLGDDFQICPRMQYAWYYSGYMFESVYGGGLLVLRPLVSDSHMFVAGLPEEYTCANILGDDPWTVSAFSTSLVRQRIHVHVSQRPLVHGWFCW